MHRRHLFMAGAFGIVVVSISLMFGGYLFAVRHYHWPLIRGIARFEFVRTYLLGDLKQLLDVVAAQDSDQGAFNAIWDTNGSGILLSKRMFEMVEIHSEPKYRYRPNLRKVMFNIELGSTHHLLETEDTPEVREAARHVRGTVMTAAYDEHRFRKVDPDVAADCSLHVMFLGDSFTDGVWVNDSDTFVNRYGHLARERGGTKVCPVNAGVDGYGSSEEAYVLEQEFDAAGRPGVVILMFFPNDVDTQYEPVLLGTDPELDRHWRESLNWLRSAAQFSKSHGSTFVLAAIPPVEQLAHPETRANYQDKLRQFCERESIAFVDLFEGLRDAGGRSLYLDWDPHFNSRGHAVVAEILERETRALLSAARDR